MINNLAPIILFVYNRPEHTKKTLKALANNLLAPDSKLYIFCDGVPKNSSVENTKNNNLVKKVIREQQWCKEVIIVESEINKGLANSIISGVTEIVKKYGKIIVLEDDLITSKYFLKFMNDALIFYEVNEKVIQISGFGFPAPKIKKSNTSYFLPITSTWGWATWKRAWETIDFKCDDYSILKKNKEMSYKFNCNGSYNYKKMFFDQMEGTKVSSWGIRFYWNAFKQNALILYPDASLISNNGWDNSGRHKDSYEIFPMDSWDTNYRVENFPKKIELDSNLNKIINKYLKKQTSLLAKIRSKFKF